MKRDRQRVAYEILAKTVYGKKKRAEIGIDRLVEEEVYAGAFPLHDVCTCTGRGTLALTGVDRLGLETGIDWGRLARTGDWH